MSNIKITKENISKAVRCYDLEGSMLEDFMSLRDAAKATKVGENLISNCVNARINYAGCFQFRFIKTVTPERIGSVLYVYNGGRFHTPVAKYWKNKLICVYNSISEANDKNDIPDGHISLHLSSKMATVKGFTFKFI